MSRWVRVSFTAFFAAVLCFSVYFIADLDVPAASAADASASSGMTALQAGLKSHFNLRQPSFTLKYKGPTNSLSSQIDKAVKSILDSDDSLGYTVSSYRWSTSFTKNEATVKVQVNYWEDAKQTAFVVNRTKQIAKEIIKPGMNAHEKVKAVHDWVVTNVAYDRSLVQHSAYAALTGGETVCQGYALLTYRLLNDAGVPNRIAEGTVSTGLHAWNVVNVDGKWYHLDTTFDDPVPDVKGRTRYDYFLLTDKQIRKDHRWTKTYPAAITSYVDTLSILKESDSKKSAFYEGLEHSLGYDLLKEENSAQTIDELAIKVKSARKAGQSSIRVRWTGGSKLDLQQLLEAVPALSSIRYTQTPFPLGDPGDSVLTIEFK